MFQPPETPKQAAFDVGLVMDAIDQITEILTGLRAKLTAAGFSETAAEQMCVQQHAFMVQSALITGSNT
jgi:hypothetical protein